MAEETEKTVTQRIMEDIDSDIYIGAPSAEQGLGETQIHVEPWNRTTIADGLWLQENAIAPFSARDILLANEIDKTNERVSSIENSGLDGRELDPITRRVYSADQYGNGPYWPNNNYRLLPDGDKVPAYSLIYMPNNPAIGEGGVLSMNSKTKSYQIIMNDNGMYIDYATPDHTTTIEGDLANVTADDSSHNMQKVYTEKDKPTDSSVRVLTSAGFEELKGDGLTVDIFKNGNQHVVSARNYPGWYKTVNHAIETETPLDDESYLAGGGCTVASATHSLLLGAGSDFNGLVEYSDVHAASGALPKTSQIRYSYLNHGGFNIGENVKIENAIVNADKKIHDGTHLDSSFVIIDGADFSGNFQDSVAVKQGGVVSGAQYSLVLGNGGDQKDIYGSLVAEQGGNLENIDNSISVGNVFAKNHNYLIAAGGGLRLENASGYGNVVVGGGFTQNYSMDYNVFVGGNNCVVNRACKSSIGVGEKLYLGGYGLLAVGSAIYVKGRAQIVAGSANNVWDSNFGNGGNLLLGYNNNSDAEGTLVAGSDNSVYGRQSIILGDNNFLSQYGRWSITMGEHNVQGNLAEYGIIAGNNNTAYSERAYIFGDSNKAGGSQSFILGDHNDVGSTYGLFVGSGNHGSKNSQLTIGWDNNNYGDYAVAIGMNNTVSHPRAFVQGIGNTTTKDGQILFGDFTLSLSDSMLEIGCGLNAQAKQTLFRIDTAGNIYCAGKVYANALESNTSWTNKMIHP